MMEKINVLDLFIRPIDAVDKITDVWTACSRGDDFPTVAVAKLISMLGADFPVNAWKFSLTEHPETVITLSEVLERSVWNEYLSLRVLLDNIIIELDFLDNKPSVQIGRWCYSPRTDHVTLTYLLEKLTHVTMKDLEKADVIGVLTAKPAPKPHIRLHEGEDMMSIIRSAPELKTYGVGLYLGLGDGSIITITRPDIKSDMGPALKKIDEVTDTDPRVAKIRYLYVKALSNHEGVAGFIDSLIDTLGKDHPVHLTYPDDLDTTLGSLQGDVDYIDYGWLSIKLPKHTVTISTSTNYPTFNVTGISDTEETP